MIGLQIIKRPRRERKIGKNERNEWNKVKREREGERARKEERDVREVNVHLASAFCTRTYNAALVKLKFAPKKFPGMGVASK
jgi:hypothetical protein